MAPMWVGQDESDLTSRRRCRRSNQPGCLVIDLTLDLEMGHIEHSTVVQYRLVAEV